LIDRVRGLGMQFGLWFEPEMVNPDSDLYRAHPDWVLAPADRNPLVFRHQLVLDLGRPEVREYLFSQVSAILTQYPISYVKWDHNRDLIDGAVGAGGAGVHAQTLGFYALLDALRARHPDVEWESCASGGARVDLGVLERVQRVWTSDVTDALSRQGIQRWTAQLVAPEYVGAHVSAPVNQQTERVLSLDFRAATAFFGDLGVEWDVTRAGDPELARLAEWITVYKQHRALLHSGRMVRVDSPDPAIWMHGAVAGDGSQAVFAYVQLDEQVADPVPFTVPGLDPGRRYRATRLLPTATSWAADGMVLSGAVLADVGLPAPARAPCTANLVHLAAVDTLSRS
jgi:alpha-galactosidase